MAILLTAATRRELAAVLGPEALDLAISEPGDSIALSGREVVPLATGIGVVNAAFSLGQALERIGPEGVLGLGIAGSFDLDALGLGRTCLVSREVWPEFGVEDGCLADAGALRLPLAEIRGKEIRQALDLEPESRALELGLEIPVDLPRAVSVTVSAVTATSGRADRLRRLHGALVENMEGFAWALACARAGVPFVQLRAVSNLVGERDKGRWVVKKALASLTRCLGTLMKPRLSPGEKNG